MSNKNKFPAFLVNLSSPLMINSCCKFCGGFPEISYRIKKGVYWKDISNFIKQFAWVTEHHHRMCTDHYLFDNPSLFNNISHFSYSINYNGYNPKLHIKHCINRSITVDSTLIECIICECGRTIWGCKLAKDNPEISNRKSVKTYPKKFVY